jgi:hypothetical protein
LNGLRVSEATDASIEALGTERGHRTLTITGKGGKVVTIPLAPRTARAIDLAIGERCEGPIFVIPDGRRLDRHGAARIVRRVARRAGITKIVGPLRPAPQIWSVGPTAVLAIRPRLNGESVRGRRAPQVPRQTARRPEPARPRLR